MRADTIQAFKGPSRRADESGRPQARLFTLGGADRGRSLPSGGDGGDATARRLARSQRHSLHRAGHVRYRRRRLDQTKEPKTLTLPLLPSVQSHKAFMNCTLSLTP
jgi:hypothetical protein